MSVFPFFAVIFQRLAAQHQGSTIDKLGRHCLTSRRSASVSMPAFFCCLFAVLSAFEATLALFCAFAACLALSFFFFLAINGI